VSIYYLDGNRFHRSLSAGIRRLLSRQDYLNKINVFPVPDSDTGTNMGYTLSSIEDGYPIHKNDTIASVAFGVAELTINNARGNSGAILAQFFSGFAEGVKNKTKLTTKEFTSALQVAKQYAYNALLTPTEGTILTVISDWINAVHVRSTTITDFKNLFVHGLNVSKKSLSETTSKLKALSKAGVVDAGAQGFVDILEGINTFIDSGEVEEMSSQQTKISPEIDTISFDEKYRFCTECIIQGSNLNQTILKKSLMSLGDSIVVAGHSLKQKIHIHTDNPKRVFTLCNTFGKVSDEKADDMIRQQHDAHGLHQDIALVVDSGCDLPEEILRQYNIHMVPVRLNFGPEHFVDKVSISSSEFWEKLDNNPHHPQTSQPTPGDFLRHYQLLSSHYKQTISLHIPANLSGTFQSAVLASQKIKSMPITVMDSKNGSIGIGLIAIRAAEAISAGKSVEEIQLTIQEAIQNTSLYLGLTTLKYGVRGGRLPASVKTIADAFRMNPILSFTDKGLKPVGVTFGRKNILQKLKQFIVKKMDLSQPIKLGISHANCAEIAEEFSNDFSKMIGKENVFISEIGPALGSHSGPGAMVIATQTLGEIQYD
jgi:hypothetical protein